MNDGTRHESITSPSAAGIFSSRVCAAMLVLYSLYFARSLVIPVVTATALYLTLRPVVRRAHQWGIPTSIAAVGVIVATLMMLSAATYAVVEPARHSIASAPQYLSEIRSKLSFVGDRLNDVEEVTETLTEVDTGDSASAERKPVPVQIKQATWTSGWIYLSGTGNVMSFLTICAVLLYFLLANGDSLLRNLMRTLPSFTSRRRLIEVIQNVQEGLGSYLAHVSLINAGLGVCVMMAMWLLGMPSPLTWGMMAFAFNFIPILGALTGGVIIFAVALVTFDPTYYALVVAATFLVLTALEGQFITPAILGRSMSISPVLVFLSIVLWGWMWGIMGVFLSVPILIAIRMICEGYEELHPFAIILGAQIKTDAGDPSEPPESTSELGPVSNTDGGPSAAAKPTDPTPPVPHGSPAAGSIAT